MYNLKSVKNTHGGVLLLVNFTKSNTPSTVFSRFLNCTNGTKSYETSYIFQLKRKDLDFKNVASLGCIFFLNIPLMNFLSSFKFAAKYS